MADVAWLAAAAVAAGAGGIGAGYALRAGRDCPREGERVALIGDSLAVGLAAPLAQRLHACGADGYAEADNGSHTSAWTGTRLDGALAFRPSLLLVSLGGNDSGVQPGTLATQARAIVKRAHHAGALVLWIAPPGSAENEAAAAAWSPVADAIFSTNATGVAIGPDGIHPTAAGMAQLAELIWRWTVQRSWASTRRPAAR